MFELFIYFLAGVGAYTTVKWLVKQAFLWYVRIKLGWPV